MINDYINAWAKLIKESEDDDARKQAIADSFESQCEDIMYNAVEEYLGTTGGNTRDYIDGLVQFALDNYWEDLCDEAVYGEDIETVEDFTRWICKRRLNGIDEDYIAKYPEFFDDSGDYIRDLHDDDYDEYDP